MPRYNKIYAGPVDQRKPQTRERIGSVALLPGTLVTINGSNEFAYATAATVGKVYIVQDNYLALKGVDTAWPAGDRVVAMELLDEQFYNVRVPTGVNVTQDAALTPGASGKLALASTSDLVVLMAEEPYNNTSGADQLVRARPAKGYLTAAA